MFDSGKVSAAGLDSDMLSAVGRAASAAVANAPAASSLGGFTTAKGMAGRLGTTAMGTTAAAEAVAGASAAAVVQPCGGTTCTMLPQRGQEWISPMAPASRILRRARQVSQMIRKGSTKHVLQSAGKLDYRAPRDSAPP
jgi:hypothetical protein